MPSALCDCILVPIPKGMKDPTSSDNYRPIALAPTFSKALESSILLTYPQHFTTSDLQFGFKKGLSTSISTGLIKNVIFKFVHNGSSIIYGCFLDALQFRLLTLNVLLETLMVSSVLIRAANSKHLLALGLQWFSLTKFWRWHTLQQKSIAPSPTILLPKKHIAMLLYPGKDSEHRVLIPTWVLTLVHLTKEPTFWRKAVQTRTAAYYRGDKLVERVQRGKRKKKLLRHWTRGGGGV